MGGASLQGGDIHRVVLMARMWDRISVVTMGTFKPSRVGRSPATNSTNLWGQRGGGMVSVPFRKVGHRSPSADSNPMLAIRRVPPKRVT